MSGTEKQVDERLMQRMSAMLADQLRTNIVCECKIRPMSPRGFRQEFGGPSLVDDEAFAAMPDSTSRAGRRRAAGSRNCSMPSSSWAGRPTPASPSPARSRS